MKENNKEIWHSMKKDILKIVHKINEIYQEFIIFLHLILFRIGFSR